MNRRTKLQVSTDCGFVLITKPLVHILVHKRRLPNTKNYNQLELLIQHAENVPTVTKNDNLQFDGMNAGVNTVNG